MTRSTKLMLAILLAASPAIRAQDSLLNSLRHETDQYQWQQVGVDMAPGKYRQALSHNRRLTRDTLTDTIVSFGVPKMAVNLMGAAAVLAVDDLQLPLNKSKTLALKLEDAIDEDRSALLQMKFDW